MVETYKIGSVSLTQQALSIFIIGVFMFFMSVYMVRDKGSKGVVFSLMILGFVFYNTYLTNCIVVGKCNKLAWVLVALMILATLGTPGNIKSIFGPRAI